MTLDVIDPSIVINITIVSPVGRKLRRLTPYVRHLYAARLLPPKNRRVQ